MRKQFTDCFITSAATTLSVAADSTDTNEVNSSNFDTGDCCSPSIIANVRSLGANKTIALRLQHSDTTTAADFENLSNDLESNGYRANVAVSAIGIHEIAYNGQKKYIRLVIRSTSASPASNTDVYFQQHGLIEKPDNVSF